MTSIKIVLSVLFIVIATSFIDAQTVDKKGGPGSQETVNKPPQFKKGMRQRMEGHKKFMSEKLKLTEQQVSKIESLRSEHMKKMIDLKAEFKKSMIDLKSIKNKDNFTRSDVIAGVEKTDKIRNDIALENANHRMDIWETLTPEQRKIAKDNPQWLGEKKHQRMNKRFRFLSE